jgi:hypothetical protein
MDIHLIMDEARIFFVWGITMVSSSTQEIGRADPNERIQSNIYFKRNS